MMPVSKEQILYYVAAARAALGESERLQASNPSRASDTAEAATMKSDESNDQQAASDPAESQQLPRSPGQASSSSLQAADPRNAKTTKKSGMAGDSNLGNETLADSPGTRRSPRLSKLGRTQHPAMNQSEGEAQNEASATSTRRSARLVEKAVKGAKAEHRATADEHQSDECAEPTPTPSSKARGKRPAAKPRAHRRVLDGTYNVKEILDVRPDKQVKGGYLYLTSWQGYSDQTWEPEEHFDPILIEDFKDRLRHKGKGWKIGEQ